MNKSDNNDRYFFTDHLLNDLKGHTVRSGFITIAAQIIKFFLNLISTMVLARLLTPSDFGLIAMVMVVTGFIGIFKDAGLSMATVQRATINHDQVSTLFWINVALSIVLGLLTAGLAPGLAWLYDETRLVWITVALAATFVLSGLSVQHSALMTRQMRFRDLALLDVLAMAAGIACGIAAAWWGLSYWSLVIMTVATGLVNVVMVWAMCRWVPGPPRQGCGVRPMLAFGGNLTGANVIGYFSTNIDKLLIGKLFGAQQLGLYTRAYQIMALPIGQFVSPIMQVARVALCRVAHTPEPFERATLSLIKKTSLLCMYLVTCLFVMADWIILIVLGPGWEEAVALFRVLALFAIVEPIASIAAAVLISAGKAHAFLRWKIFSLVVIIVGLLVGLPWGVFGVVTAYSVSGFFIRMPAFLWYVGQHTSISAMKMNKAMIPFILITIISVLALMGLRLVIADMPVWKNFTIVSLASMLIYFGLCFMFPSGRDQLYELRSYVLRFKSKIMVIKS